MRIIVIIGSFLDSNQCHKLENKVSILCFLAIPQGPQHNQVGDCSPAVRVHVHTSLPDLRSAENPPLSAKKT